VKRFVPILAMALVMGACGDDDATTTTAAVTTTAASTTTAAAATTTPSTSAPTTTSGGDMGPTDCNEIWPESDVQAVAGVGYEFFGANPDMSACTFLEGTNGIALAWRVSTRDEFGLSRDGASEASGVIDLEVCDGAFYTEIPGPVLIMEVYSESQGRAYNATISGPSSPDALDWATDLLTGVC
jgi:hypothetical protein